METALKQRLIGAIVLVALAVIFLPMLFDGSGAAERFRQQIPIPEEPEVPEPRLSPTGESDVQGILTRTETPDESTTSTQVASGESQTTNRGSGGTGAEAGEANDTTTATQAGQTTTATASEGGATPAAEETNITNGWVVQVGAFSYKTNALVLRNKLDAKGFDAMIEKMRLEGDTLWRVLLGPVAGRAEGEALKRRVEAARDMPALLRRYSP